MEYDKRLRCEAVKTRIMTAEEAAMLIQDGMNVAVSGFTPSGCPKAVPSALAEQVRTGKRTLRISLYSGASTGEEIDSEWAEAGIVSHRMPYMTSKTLRAAVNGKTALSVSYSDIHLGQMAQNARYGFYGRIDVAVIEAAAITEDGGIIPTTAVGCSQSYIDIAEKVIIELNLAQPAELEGIHDIYRMKDPPFREPIPLTRAGQRIGQTWLDCPAEKIAAVVITEREEKPRALAPADAASQKIAEHIIDFLVNEQKAGRLSAGELPLQSGVGSVANAVLLGLKQAPFSHLSFYSEVMQDGILDLIDGGKADMASATSLSLTKEGMARLLGNLEHYRDRIILRDSEISNNPEVIRRLGVISMNTAIEADIYGNVNSSHMNGTHIYNGIGGSGDYARNAYLSIFMTNSTAKNGSISCIVPFATHIDHTEHDVDVLVTEQGYADLRGLAPKERAIQIIENCANPSYRPQLRAYFERACRETGGAQTPHVLSECFAFHERLRQYGTMLEENERSGETLC